MYEAQRTGNDPLLYIIGFDLQPEDKVCGVQTGSTYAWPRAETQIHVIHK